LPSKLATRIRAIETYHGPRERALAGDAVALVLDDDLDIARGDMLASPGDPPSASDSLDATLCWLADASLDPRRSYLLRHTTREVAARIARVDHLLDVDTHGRLAPRALARNDIAGVHLALAQPIAAEPYARSRATGSFILVDAATNDTVAAGMVQ